MSPEGLIASTVACVTRVRHLLWLVGEAHEPSNERLVHPMTLHDLRVDLDAPRVVVGPLTSTWQPSASPASLDGAATGTQFLDGAQMLAAAKGVRRRSDARPLRSLSHAPCVSSAAQQGYHVWVLRNRLTRRK